MVNIMAAGACERLMPVYQIKKHDIAEDHNIKIHTKTFCQHTFICFGN